jgi:predicted Zn-dependent protease
MDDYKKTNHRSPYLVIFGAMVLVTLLASSGLYALTYGVPYQPEQQSATIIAASANQNTTGLASSPNGTSNVANETMTTTTTATAPNVTFVEFVSNIEQIRGHLDQALVNKESGNDTLAQTHTLHPIEEVYASIEEQLVSQNDTLNKTLSVALQDLTSSVPNVAVEEFEGQIDSINMQLDNVVQTVVPSSELSNHAFNASVVARLLDIAGHEYGEAIANGTIIEIVEYQDGQAFINRAQTIFNSSTSSMNQSMAQEVEEVNELFSNLKNAVNNRDDPANVETTIKGIIHELAEITGLSESQLTGEEVGAEEQDPIAIINNIKSLLVELVAAYRSQDYQGAENIAIEAYLENYEHVEAPIAEHDQQLMEQTEVMLREELRRMITDRVPIEQIEQHIVMINGNLDRATQLLSQ